MSYRKTLVFGQCMGFVTVMCGLLSMTSAVIGPFHPGFDHGQHRLQEGIFLQTSLIDAKKTIAKKADYWFQQFLSQLLGQQSKKK